MRACGTARALATAIHSEYQGSSTFLPRDIFDAEWKKTTEAERQLLSHEDVVQILRAEIDRAGTESAWARRTGANRSSINLALRGRVGLQKNILDALGLKEGRGRRLRGRTAAVRRQS